MTLRLRIFRWVSRDLVLYIIDRSRTLTSHILTSEVRLTEKVVEHNKGECRRASSTMSLTLSTRCILLAILVTRKRARALSVRVSVLVEEVACVRTSSYRQHLALDEKVVAALLRARPSEKVLAVAVQSMI